ncbi:hypothetical protein Ahia01_000314800 [Argonauta hians]
MEDLLRNTPHIYVSNVQMACWRDVRIILFPDCTESNCTIVLNSLKFALKYPLQRKNIHKCSSEEKTKFLENFQSVEIGTIIVNLEEVWNKRQNLHELVHWKHVVSKDRSSLNCNASHLISNVSKSNLQSDFESITKIPNQIIWSIPHITVQGRHMASWSDIRDVLVPGCTGKKCTIVLNCLRLKLKYPLITQNIYTCSSNHQSKYTTNFKMLPSLDTIVNLNQVIAHWPRLVEMIVKKHWITKDPSSSFCTLFPLYHSISNSKNNHNNNSHFQDTSSELYSLNLLPFSGVDRLMYDLPGLIKTDCKGKRKIYVPIHAIVKVFPSMSKEVNNILKWQFDKTASKSWNTQGPNWDEPVILCPRNLIAQLPDMLLQTGFLSSYITSQTMLLNWTFFMKAITYMCMNSLTSLPWEEKFYACKGPEARVLKIHLLNNKSNNNQSKQLQTKSPENSNNKVLNYQLLLWEYQKTKQRSLVVLNKNNANKKKETGETPFKNWLPLTKKSPPKKTIKITPNNDVKSKNGTDKTVIKKGTVAATVTICHSNVSKETEKPSIKQDIQSSPSDISNANENNSKINSSNQMPGTKSGLSSNLKPRQLTLSSKNNNVPDNILDKPKMVKNSPKLITQKEKSTYRRISLWCGNLDSKGQDRIPSSKKMKPQKEKTVIMKNDAAIKYKKEPIQNGKPMLKITNNSKLKHNNKENIQETCNEVSENCSSKVNQGFINVDWKSVYPVHGSLIKAKPIKKNILVREQLKKDISLLRETAKLVCTCRDAYRPADKAPLSRFLQQKFNTNSSHCLVHSLILRDKTPRNMFSNSHNFNVSSLSLGNNTLDNGAIPLDKEKLFFVKHPKKVMLAAYHRQRPKT